MASAHCDLSVVIPAYNEAARLPGTLAALARARRRWPWSVEVLLVDDGSTDATVAAARAQLPELRILRQRRRTGAGAAMRRGALAACGQRVLLCDADGAVDFMALRRLWRCLDAGCDIALGSRAGGANWLGCGAPLHRRLASLAWRRLSAAALAAAPEDLQCGFKLFSRRAVRSIFPQLRCCSFAIYAEIVARAQGQGLSIGAVAVPWQPMPGSQVRLWRDAPWMAAELWRLRRRGP